jgi:hypothetical protein
MRFLTSFAALLSVANAIPHVRSELNIARDDERTAPASHEVAFGSVAFAGSGCPASTVSTQLSSDVSTFTFFFSKFIAQAGQGVDASEYRKNCQLSTKIQYPSGWQFSVYKADYRGYAKIPAGTTGTAKATYYFSGESDQVYRRKHNPRTRLDLANDSAYRSPPRWLSTVPTTATTSRLISLLEPTCFGLPAVARAYST